MAAGESSKGGYDCTFVFPPPKHLECPICLLIVREPHLTGCCGSHYFCRTCIERIGRDGRTCPLCNQGGFRVFPHKGLKREVDALQVYCPHKVMGCSWMGELRQLDNHVSQQATSGCNYIDVACAYGCGRRIQRRLLAAHHTVECPMRPVEVRIAGMMKQLQQQMAELKESQITEAKKHATEVAELRRRQAEYEKQLQLQTTTVIVAQLKSKMEDNSKQIQQILKANAALKAENELLRNEVKVIESRLMPVPPVHFTVNNYLHHEINNMVYNSSPFYSDVRGYKFHVEVYTKSARDGQGAHIFVSVAVMKGEYDDTLQWPFQGRLKLGIRNPKTADLFCSRTVTFDKCTPKQCCCKPEGCVSLPSYGYDQFLSSGDVCAIATNDRLHFTVLEVEVFSLLNN